ncbi:MAG TPA: GNAT family N-acetyltransferase [Streptosporangiaceae bacterium]
MTAHPTRTVVRADKADADVLSEVIAQAFHPLAPSEWLIDDPVARRDIFPGYFRLYVEHALEHGVVQTTQDRTAAALWIPMPAEPPEPSPEYAARLTAVTGRWASRFHTFDAALDSHHPAGTPHYHLAIIGVRPDRQGQGAGTALLNAYHQELDDELVAPAFLEASDLRTRQIYLRHGYVDHGAPIELPDGPKMYPMWRAGRAGAGMAGS